MKKYDSLISTRRLASILSVDLPVIYKLIKSEEIPFYTVGGQYRFYAQEVLETFQNKVVKEKFNQRWGKIAKNETRYTSKNDSA